MGMGQKSLSKKTQFFLVTSQNAERTFYNSSFDSLFLCALKKSDNGSIYKRKDKVNIQHY